MAKYFPFERIKRASGHLQNYNSNWVLVPLVFAVNDVNDVEEVNVRTEGKPGTDAFFAEYFNGSLIGLPTFERANVLRPRFSDTLNSLRGANDWVIHQKSLLWANGYSSRGYRDMVLSKLVSGTNSKFQLNAEFWTEWYVNLPDTFRFSELLVWLYAFHGVPDHINDWDSLCTQFQEKFLGHGRRFQRGYGARFNIANAWPWEEKFLAQRPTDEEYQRELIPSIFDNPLPLIPQKDDEPLLSDTDPRLLDVKDLLRDGFAGVIFIGPPGTSKSHFAKLIGLKLVDEDMSRIRFIQFHASYQYEDFVEGFVPDEEKGFRLVPKHFLEMVKSATDDPESRLHIIVIDELSRSDPARVFGEALTYVEMSKRGQEFHLSSGKPCIIPSNLVFLATMNPQDRGVEEVEQAFERRFAKIPMNPSHEILEEMLTARGLDDGLKGRIVEFFLYLNRNKNSLAHLGHAYFHRIENEAGLKRLWDNQLRFQFERAFQLDMEGFRDIEMRFERVLDPPRAPQAISAAAGPAEPTA